MFHDLLRDLYLAALHLGDRGPTDRCFDASSSAGRWLLRWPSILRGGCDVPKRAFDFSTVGAVIGIDAAIRKSGVCVMSRQPSGCWQSPVHWLVRGVETISQHAERLKDYSDALVLIECPTWKSHGTKEVRAAAISWERALIPIFGKSCVHRIDPRAWQCLLLKGVPDGEIKSRVAWFVQRVLRYAPSEISHDELDAICIARYGMYVVQGAVAI